MEASTLCVVGGGADDVRVARILNGQGTHAEVLTACSSEITVGTIVMVNTGLGEHGIVLDLGFPKKPVATGKLVSQKDSTAPQKKTVRISSQLRAPKSGINLP